MDGSPEFEVKPLNNIEAQKGILDQIHLKQIDTFQETGILDKVKASLGDEQSFDLAQPMASVVKINIEGSDDVITQYRIALAKTQHQDNGGSVTNYKYVPVAESIQGSIMPMGEFNNKDAAVVVKMIEGLQESKEKGILPNLDANCMKINNPHTGITKYKS